MCSDTLILYWERRHWKSKRISQVSVCLFMPLIRRFLSFSASLLFILISVLSELWYFPFTRGHFLIIIAYVPELILPCMRQDTCCVHVERTSDRNWNKTGEVTLVSNEEPAFTCIRRGVRGWNMVIVSKPGALIELSNLWYEFYNHNGTVFRLIAI